MARVGFTHESPTNRIVCEDCLIAMPLIPDGSIDMVMCDPPYGTTACKWDSVIRLGPMWKQLKRIVKPSGAIVVMASQPFTTTLIASNMKMFKYCWVWEKNKGTGFLNSKKRPLVYSEDIVVFYQKQPMYNPHMSKGHKKSNGATRTIQSELYGKQITTKYNGSTERYPSNLLRIKVLNNDSAEKVHPTQKPVALMEYLIQTYTEEGEIVLDFTMGSGTTGVACKNLGRKFIGIEKDEKYFEIAKARIAEATNLLGMTLPIRGQK